jgi:hypothetical protein
MERRAFLWSLTLSPLAAPLAAGCSTGPTGPSGDARRGALPELTALAKEAYVYTFPLYAMYRARYDALERSGAPNRFQHARTLATPASRAVTAPNNDTLYSSAWLDLSQGPLVLHVPDTAGRYYSLAFMDFYTNNFAYVGRRTTGTKAGDFVIVGSRGQGERPAGIPVIAAPTNGVWLLGRILVSGVEDLPTVHALQNQLTLTALSRDDGGTAPRRRAGIGPKPEPNNPWNYFAVVNAALTENPPPARDRQVVVDLAKIGIGPDASFDAARFSTEERAALLAGVGAAKRELETALIPRAVARPGWTKPRAELGNFGTDYFFRASVAQVGLAALEPEEAVYLSPTGDVDGRPTHGAHRYLLHFPKGGLPPVDAFWSLTMYQVEPDQRRFLVENSLNRYSIGDRTKGLVYNADGSLDISIQHQSPCAAREANWLPAPEGPFVLSLRAYQPRLALLNGQYQVPVLQRRE